MSHSRSFFRALYWIWTEQARAIRLSRQPTIRFRKKLNFEMRWRHEVHENWRNLWNCFMKFSEDIHPFRDPFRTKYWDRKMLEPIFYLRLLLCRVTDAKVTFLRVIQCPQKLRKFIIQSLFMVIKGSMFIGLSKLTSPNSEFYWPVQYWPDLILYNLPHSELTQLNLPDSALT